MSTVCLPPKIVLGPESAGILLTLEEFDGIEEYDEDYRYELIHGVLVVSPFPAAEEADPNDMLGHWLRDYRDHHRQGIIMDATLPQHYMRTRTSRRLADRAIWAGLGRLPHRLRDVPTIAVEFVSAGRRNRQRDYVDKRQEYMEAGVSEYWIIDRFQRTCTVVRNHPEGPQEQVISENETYCTPLLPGFELPLARLIAMANRWAEAQ